MQVICNRAEQCRYATEKGCPSKHFLEHAYWPICSKKCRDNAVCVPVQSDFERGQEWLRQIAQTMPGVISGEYLRSFDSTSEPMPGGICRRCGHKESSHWYSIAYEAICCHTTNCLCDCFVPAKPVAPAKKDVSFVDALTYDAGSAAGQADCAKTHEALRKEGRREVVEFVDELFWNEFDATERNIWAAKKKELGV